MPSNIDPTHPATGVAVSKAASRANWAAAKAEIEHGGLFAPAGLGALERPVADRLAETISARDFGALGDDSATTVKEWLTGGTHSRGAADLAELRVMIGIADLELTDTIDWAAITAANNFARERPVYLPAGRYKLARALSFDRGGLVGEVIAAGSPTYSVRVSRKAGAPAFDAIRLEPTGNNRHFIFKNINIAGGTRGLYATTAAGGQSIEQHSVFEDLYFTGAEQEGLFFEDLQAIGCHFRRIKAENCRSHGIRFTGRAMLNGSQIESCRSVNNRGHGFLFENTHDQAFIPGVVLSGLIAEYNDGAGVKIVGCQATMVAPYFESNDRNATGEPDLLLASSKLAGPSQVNANVVCIQPIFSNVTHPDQVKIAGSAPGPQMLSVVQPQMAGSFKIDTTNLILTMTGGRSDQFIIQGSNNPALFHAPGIDLAGARKVRTTPTQLGVRAAPSFPTGVLQVLASHTNGTVASYLLQRKSDGTVKALHVAGDDFLIFGVDTAGRITAKTTNGTATVSVHGH
jgi:hypothetical protein